MEKKRYSAEERAALLEQWSNREETATLRLLAEQWEKQEQINGHVREELI